MTIYCLFIRIVNVNILIFSWLVFIHSALHIRFGYFFYFLWSVCKCSFSVCVWIVIASICIFFGNFWFESVSFSVALHKIVHFLSLTRMNAMPYLTFLPRAFVYCSLLFIFDLCFCLWFVSIRSYGCALYSASFSVVSSGGYA